MATTNDGQVFTSGDLVPLWDRPPDFLPLRPAGGSHHWGYRAVRAELEGASRCLDAAASSRRVALLANPGLTGSAATEGLHAGIQMLLAGESADDHRHTPAALRVGIEGSETVTAVNGVEFPLGPLDVVLNPSGTWHGHTERGGGGAVWLDIVDLPLVAALGGVLFEPARTASDNPILDPTSMPDTRCFPWSEVEALLLARPSHHGVRQFRYGDGAVLPTMAVTAYALEAGATLALPARTSGAVVFAANGQFTSDVGPVEQHDVIAVRAWTPLGLQSRGGSGVVMVIDTAPAMRALGLYREEATQ